MKINKNQLKLIQSRSWVLETVINTLVWRLFKASIVLDGELNIHVHMPYTGPDGINMVEKWPNMTKVAISSSWEWPKNSGMSFFWKQKPLRERPCQKEAFGNLPKSNKFIQKRFQKVTFSKKVDSWWYLPVKIIFLPKTKMVRAVHMNIFYKMDLQFCDPKSVLLTETQRLGLQTSRKFSSGI